MNKLLSFQQKVGVVLKDSQNPFFKSSYADLNALLDVVKPILNELELSIHQPLGIDSGKNVLKTQIVDGDNMIAESIIYLPDIQDPQKIGSAITYFRRYSLQSLLMLQAIDDDSNMASNKNTVEPAKSNW